jgi:16S rRNA (guanine527-N7)-methyltransferase
MMITLASQEIINKYADGVRLTAYLDDIWQANHRFNLFSRRLKRQELTLLAAESLLPIHFGWIDDHSGPLLDIGSGWGIPAIPLLLSCPALDVTLVERSQKKADYLLLLLHRLGITAQVVNAELSTLAPTQLYRTITLRRVALDNKLTAQIRRLMAPPAIVINFGPHPRNSVDSSSEIISYSLDTLPARQMIRVQIL